MIKYIILFIYSINLSISYAQWQSSTRLTNDRAQSFAFKNCIAATEDIIHVIWSDDRNGPSNSFNLFYKRSTDGGINWESDIQLTNNTVDIYYPTGILSGSIAVSGSIVHVVWTDKRDGHWKLYYKRSFNNGENWEEDKKLINLKSWKNSNIPEFKSPSISVSDSFIHIVWRDDRDNYDEIHYIHSTNSGSSWETDIRLTYHANYTYFANNPSIAVTDKTVHVVWEEKNISTEKRGIHYIHSKDNGINWEEDIELSNNFYESREPSISTFGKFLYVVWTEQRNRTISMYDNLDIFCKRSTDEGNNWEKEVKLTENKSYNELYPYNSSNPSISASNEILHLTWTYSRATKREIFYKRSTDFGVHWGTDFRVSDDCADNDVPTIFSSNSAVHVVWCGYKDRNWEIYYNRNPRGNIFK
jgi:hypothetical protein